MLLLFHFRFFLCLISFPFLQNVTQIRTFWLQTSTPYDTLIQLTFPIKESSYRIWMGHGPWLFTTQEGCSFGASTRFHKERLVDGASKMILLQGMLFSEVSVKSMIWPLIGKQSFFIGPTTCMRLLKLRNWMAPLGRPLSTTTLQIPQQSF